MWSDKGADPWVVEVLRWGYRIPFRRVPILSKELIPYPAYSPGSIRCKALEEEVRFLLEKGAIELAPLPSPGFYRSWLELLGVLSSMIQLVPGGRLRMRSLQFVLRRSWDQVDQSTLVRWTQEVRVDLEWSLNR